MSERPTAGIIGGVSESIGTFLTLLIPGAVGLVFWILLVVERAPQLNHDFEQTIERIVRLGWGVVIVGAIVLAGMVFQIIGTQIEALWLDVRLDDRRNGKHTEEWYLYLRTVFEREPIGHRYLRTMVQKMFFELHMTPAIAVSAIGFIACWQLETINPSKAIATQVVLVHAFAFVWCLSSASQAHFELSRVRNQLLQGVLDEAPPLAPFEWRAPIEGGGFAKTDYGPSALKWSAFVTLMLAGATLAWCLDARWLLLVWAPVIAATATWLLLVAGQIRPRHVTREYPYATIILVLVGVVGSLAVCYGFTTKAVKPPLVGGGIFIVLGVLVAGSVKLFRLLRRDCG